MKIHVTQEDINKGEPQRCCTCPIALALKRYLNEPFEVWSTYVRLKDRSVYLPSVARKFMEDFDGVNDIGIVAENRRKELQPFNFDFPYETQN